MKSPRTPTIPEIIDQKVEGYYEAHTFGLLIIIVMVLGFIYGKEYQLWILIIGVIILAVLEITSFWRFKKVIIDKLDKLKEGG